MIVATNEPKWRVFLSANYRISLARALMRAGGNRRGGCTLDREGAKKVYLTLTNSDSDPRAYKKLSAEQRAN